MFYSQKKDTRNLLNSKICIQRKQAKHNFLSHVFSVSSYCLTLINMIIVNAVLYITKSKGEKRRMKKVWVKRDGWKSMGEKFIKSMGENFLKSMGKKDS